MHTFPQLRKIERKYGDRVIVIGVHSPKFPAERETANLREAVLRYRIEHPVVNDRDFAVWNQFGGRAWPTLMFVDPQGRVIGKHEGELPFEQFDPIVEGMLKEFEQRGILDPEAAPIDLEHIMEAGADLEIPRQGVGDGGRALHRGYQSSSDREGRPGRLGPAELRERRAWTTRRAGRARGVSATARDGEVGHHPLRSRH